MGHRLGLEHILIPRLLTRLCPKYTRFCRVDFTVEKSEPLLQMLDMAIAKSLHAHVMGTSRLVVG